MPPLGTFKPILALSKVIESFLDLFRRIDDEWAVLHYGLIQRFSGDQDELCVCILARSICILFRSRDRHSIFVGCQDEEVG